MVRTRFSRGAAGRWGDRVAGAPWDVLLHLGAFLLLIVAGVSCRAEPSIKPPIATIAIDSTPLIGNSNARFGIVLLSDFDCQKCLEFARGAWTFVRSNYIDTGLSNAVFRYLPDVTTVDEYHRDPECVGDYWTSFERLMIISPVGHASQGPASPPCRDATTREAPSGEALARRFGIESPPAILAGHWAGPGRLEIRVVFAGPVPAHVLKESFNAVGVRAVMSEGGRP
jgi:hypothetical protein